MAPVAFAGFGAWVTSCPRVSGAGSSRSHWYNFYPIGVPVLALPLVFLLKIKAAFWGPLLPKTGPLFSRMDGARLPANQWSALPVNVDQANWRVWDWSAPQFLRGLR